MKVVDIPLNEWMTDNNLALKAIRCKNELIWRKTHITLTFNIYDDSGMAVKKRAISKRKAELIEQVFIRENMIFQILECQGIFIIFKLVTFINKLMDRG